MTIEELFKKLEQEKQMKWTDVMSGLVEWAASKYGDEVDPETLLTTYPTFADILNAYYNELSLVQVQVPVNEIPPENVPN